MVFRPDFRPDTLRQTASAAERAGVAELWLWEDCFLQGGIAAAAVALASSETLTVGLGVLPAPLRNVVTTAMEIATLEAMFPGRIRVGIGHGVQDWMRQAGAAVASPLTLMREYVTALSDLLAGQSVTVDGRYVRLADVQLDWAPQQRVPVLIGGTGPKTLALAGEIADGVILDAQYTLPRCGMRWATSRRVGATVARPPSAQCCSWHAAQIRSPDRPIPTLRQGWTHSCFSRSAAVRHARIDHGRRRCGGAAVVP